MDEDSALTYLLKVGEGREGVEPIPRLLVIPKKDFVGLFGRESRGKTISFKLPSRRSLNVGFVPRGASTHLKLHELGHVEVFEGEGTSSSRIGTVRTYIRDELSAESYAYRKMGKDKIPPLALLDIARDAVKFFGIPSSKAVRILQEEGRRLGFKINRAPLNKLLRIIKDVRDED